MYRIRKILLVEDDPEDRLIFNDSFAELGEENLVDYEDNGEQALIHLEECYDNHQLPNLIILDLNMPGMNGTQILRAIKNDDRFRNIRVLIYSTSINKIEKEQCLLLGAEDYILKPLTYSESINKANHFRDICMTA